MIERAQSSHEPVSLLWVGEAEPPLAALGHELAQLGLSCELALARGVGQARECLNAATFDVVLLEHRLFDGTAADLWNDLEPRRTILLVTPEDGWVAARSLRRGCADYAVCEPTGWVTVALAGQVQWVLQRWRAEQTALAGERDARLLLSTVEALRKASDTLARQSLLMEVILSSLDVGIAHFDAEGRLMLHNPRFLALLELPPALMDSPLTLDDIVRFQHARGDFGGAGEGQGEAVYRYWEQGRGHQVPVYVRRTRQQGYLEVKTWTLPDGCMVRAYTDVTAQVKAREALAAERARVMEVLEGTRAGTWRWNIPTGEIHLDERWADILGYALAEIQPLSRRRWRAMVEPTDYERIQALTQRYFENRLDYYECDFRVRHKDGHWVWVLSRGRVNSRTEAGEPLVFSGIHLDISEIKQTEQALAEQQEVLETTLANISQGIAMIDADGRLRNWNRRISEMLGLPEDYLRQRPLLKDIVRRQYERGDFGPNADRVSREGRSYIQDMSEGKGSVQTPSSYLRRAPDGRALEVRTQKLPKGGWVHTYSDVTEFVHAREALARSEEQARVIAETAQDAILTMDESGRIIYTNPSAEVQFGYPEDGLTGLHYEQLMAPRYRQRESRYIGKFLRQPGRQRRVVPRTLHAVRADGSVFPVETSVAVGRVGERTVVTTILRDVSERVAAEAQIRSLNESLERRVVERTSALERSMRDMEAISYSIAHDLRAPLRAVNGYATLVDQIEGDKFSVDGRKMFARIGQAASHMGQMIDDLLNLLRMVSAELSTEPVRMALMVAAVVEVLRPAWPRSVIDVESLPDAAGDPTLLRQLWSNLIDNALKYSSRNENPKVRVGYDGARRAYFVHDNGVGFDMAYAAKLFGVFQRMQSDFPGSGVGLAIVARIVERHGGRIWAESAPGRGATFWFTLA